MMNRKFLLLPLLALLAGAAALIFVLLQAGDGDVSLSGQGVLDGGAARRDSAGQPLLPGDLDTLRGPRELAAAPGDAASAPSALAGPEPARGAVTGRLVDEAGRPVAGECAWLALEADSWDVETREGRLQRVASRGRSDEDGGFSLPARAGVDYELHAGGDAFPVAQLSAVHAGDQLVVMLEHATELVGLVIDGTTGLPVPGARVLALHDDTGVLGDAREDGTFRLGPLPPQDVVAGAWAPGYDARLVGNLAPAAGPVTLELAPGLHLQGRLLDRVSEEPLAGGDVLLVFDVVASRVGADPLPLELLVQERSATVGADGRFEFEGVPALGFTLVCTSPGYLPEEHDRFENRMLEPEEPVLISLAPADAVTGTVRIAASGLPAGGAELDLSAPGGVLARGAAGPAGEFALLAGDAPLELLLSQPTHVTARLGDLAARARVGRERDDLLLELVPVLPLALQVLDGGVPVAGAEVAARSKGAQVSQAVTDEHGLASLVHAPAGPDVDRLVLQARHGNLESLPQTLDPRDMPPGTITIDLRSGAWLGGQVIDLAGAPVLSAQVRARPAARESNDPYRSGYSGGDGRFRVGPLPPDVEYALDVSAEGFLDQELPGVFPGAADLLVALAPVVSWRGRARDATTGEPLEDFWGQLRVEVVEDGRTRQRNTSERLHLQSGVPGEFWFDLPGPGRYALRLSARDYVPVNTALLDFDGRTAPLYTELALAQAAVLEATVLDGRGRPVPGYAVAAAPWDKAQDAATPAGDLRKQSVSGRTDDDGLARLNLGAGGTYRMAGGPGLWLDDLPVVVLPGPAVARLYRLPPTGDLEVSVRDAEGRPLAGALVDVRTSKEELVHSVTRRLRSGPDAEGLVLVETLPPGDYEVSARRRNFEPARGTVLVRANMLERLTLTLQPKEPGEPAPPQAGPVGTDGAGPKPPGPPR